MKFPTMRAVRHDGRGVRLDEVRRVRPPTAHVLVRVSAVRLDRRDGEVTVGPRPVRPDVHGMRTLGRHVVGTVAAPGAGVDGWPLGRPVALQPEVRAAHGIFVPGIEHDGGLAEYLVAPVAGLVPLPRDLALAAAATLPLAARAHSMMTHAGVGPGMAVGIWGAGSLGGTAVAIARLLGAAPVIVVDPRGPARTAAVAYGADVALNPHDDTYGERLSELTNGRGLDVVLHAAPDDMAAEQAIRALGPEGRGILAGPFGRVGLCARWDGRTLSGVPRVRTRALPLLANLVARNRLSLPVPPEIAGGLDETTELLDSAVRGGAPVPSAVVIL